MTDQDYLDMIAAEVVNGFMSRGYQKPEVLPDLAKYAYDVADLMLAEKKNRYQVEQQ
jgi:hypothetical protein